ncbi:MAG: GAF domain-containing sensor histidine kinase, partial [Alphaproteobacteria bacterium]|nr:GAF domain-containing sensor histidine kinase [Alphaproteobacteria bacterium]
MGALIREHDWTRSPLGAPQQWPDALKMSVSICLNSRFPMVLWWGPEFIMLYNDAWRPVLGATKHPSGLGRPGIESWPEIWDIIGLQMRGVLERGEATWSEDLLLVLDRYGYLEEAYFTYSYSPIKDVDGRIGGVFSAVSETTDRVLGERRLEILREVGERTAETKSVEDACRKLAELLRGKPDVPFALLYLVEADSRVASLVATVGIEAPIAEAPAEIDLASEDRWGVSRVVRTGETLVLDDLASRFGPLPGGLWPEPTRSAVILPVAKAGQQAGTTGVLVAGINPRRALDDRYRSFFALVAGHMATAVANARSYQEERRRAEALAEIDRAKTAFFSNASHEFRTPLTLMISPLEDWLVRYAASDQVIVGKREVELVHRNSLRLLKLVNTLLDFSRLEAGRVQATYEPVDIAGFTAELASTFQSAMDRARLRFVIDCVPVAKPVYVDRDMWEKIVLNLISNAFKYTFDGEIGVTLRTVLNEKCVALTVRDTGVGIPEHELPRLFDRFHRIEGQRGRTQEGTGIGLAL